MGAKPEGKIVVQQGADRIVQRPCPDKRPAADEYPDTDERLALVPQGDFEQLGKVTRAGRDLRDVRLKIDDVQIKGCAE